MSGTPDQPIIPRGPRPGTPEQGAWNNELWLVLTGEAPVEKKALMAFVQGRILDTESFADWALFEHAKQQRASASVPLPAQLPATTTPGPEEQQAAATGRPAAHAPRPAANAAAAAAPAAGAHAAPAPLPAAPATGPAAHAPLPAPAPGGLLLTTDMGVSEEVGGRGLCCVLHARMV